MRDGGAGCFLVPCVSEYSGSMASVSVPTFFQNMSWSFAIPAKLVRGTFGVILRLILGGGVGVVFICGGLRVMGVIWVLCVRVRGEVERGVERVMWGNYIAD